MANDYVDRAAVEAQAARDWAADAKLHEEFGRFEVYCAYVVAEAAGRVKIHGGGGGVVRGADVSRGAVTVPTQAQARNDRHLPGGDLHDAATRRAYGY